MNEFESVILGHRPRPSAQEAPRVVEGRVKSVDATGMHFTIPSWDAGKHVFGPAPWPMSRVETADLHDHAETVPAAGARCLVVFVGNGIENPWVVGWWPA